MSEVASPPWVAAGGGTEATTFSQGTSQQTHGAGDLHARTKPEIADLVCQQTCSKCAPCT